MFETVTEMLNRVTRDSRDRTEKRVAYAESMGTPDTLERALHERLMWIMTACEFTENMQYYRDICVEVGRTFGVAARTCDDGSVLTKDDTLCSRLVGIALRRSWQPIETAPKDGTIVVLYAAAYGDLPAFVTSGAWHPDAGWCVCELRTATHWMCFEHPDP